jgi:hypothetical protein
MTALPHSTRRKLSLLKLAEELQNVSKACRIMGYHRDTFYAVRRAFQVGGTAALVEARRGARAPHPNRVGPEIETRILDYALQFPHGAQRVANELRLQDQRERLRGPRRLAAPRPRDPDEAAASPGTHGPGVERRDTFAVRRRPVLRA